MSNQVTDRFRFVQTENVQALPMWERNISSEDGYSLEIFRSGEHFASVRPRTAGSASTTRRKSVQKPQQMRIDNGDVIYWVNIVPQPIPVVGIFTTLDNFACIYDITLDLVVSDPVLFVQGYRLEKDPVLLTMESFKKAFLDYAAKTEYDKLNVLRPPDNVWNDSLSKDTGMRVAQISRWSLRGDPQRLETAKLYRDAVKDMLAIIIKSENQMLEDQFERIRDFEKRIHDRDELARQREFERSELEKQKAFDREERTRQHIFELHYQLRTAAAQELKEILKERIRDTFDRGKPIDSVAEESLKLLDAFQKSLYKGYIDATTSNGHSSNKVASSGDDATTKLDVNIDLFRTQPNMSDLSDRGQKEPEEE